MSATDCAGSLVYNEDLAERRSKHIYKTLSKVSNNEVIIKPVGERELLKDCDEVMPAPLSAHRSVEGLDLGVINTLIRSHSPTQLPTVTSYPHRLVAGAEWISYQVTDTKLLVSGRSC